MSRSCLVRISSRCDIARRSYARGVIPSEARFLLGVRSNAYGFAIFPKGRLRVQNWHWPSRSLQALLRSFPTPRPTGNCCQIASGEILNSTRATTFASQANIALQCPTLYHSLLLFNNNLIGYNSLSTTRLPTQLHLS